jgi:NAD(P)-dependent dehydrogenase (short-subunit alcohol dehydrogenase family)
MSSTSQSTALVTGAGRGLGLALAQALLSDGWRVVVDARRAVHLNRALPGALVVPGDVTDPAHRAALAATVAGLGRLDLLVNNASDLGPSPLPPLADMPLTAVRQVQETNVLAPLALIQQFLPLLRAAGGTVLNISSDAAVEAYPGWGGYGSSKAALDQLSAGSSRSPRWPCTRSTRATCARRCTRPRSRARTSPTGRHRRRWSPRCCG